MSDKSVRQLPTPSIDKDFITEEWGRALNVSIFSETPFLAKSFPSALLTLKRQVICGVFCAYPSLENPLRSAAMRGNLRLPTCQSLDGGQGLSIKFTDTSLILSALTKHYCFSYPLTCSCQISET